MAGLAGFALGMLLLLGFDPRIGAAHASETGTAGRRSLREVLQDEKGPEASVELVQDMLERAVQLCTGNPLEQWQKLELENALKENMAQQSLVPSTTDSSARVILEVSGDTLRSLESVLGSIKVYQIRPCLTEQLVGSPQMESQRRQLIFNIIDTAFIDCGMPKISSDTEMLLWEALNNSTYYTSVEAEDSEKGLILKLMVDVELLEVLAEAVAADADSSVDSVRWCLQSILSGGPVTIRTPMVAQRLIEAAQFSCTQTTFDEHGARETWENLMEQGIADLVGFYEYSDGVGGSSGEGRVRFVGRYPVSFLRDQFTSVVLKEGNATEREELFDCLMAIFDGTGILGSEEIAIFVDGAHAMCAEDEEAYTYGTTSQEFDRLTRAMIKHNITWGSRILGPQESMIPPLSEEAVPGRRRGLLSEGPVLEYWIELDAAYLPDAISILWADDPLRGEEVLPCYKTEIEGHYSDQLSNPEWALLFWAAPQCYPIDVNEDTAGLILEGYIRPRNNYINGTVLVSSFELTDEALQSSTGLKVGSAAAAKVPGCIKSMLDQQQMGWRVAPSAAASSLFHLVSSSCASESLLAPDWERAAYELDSYVPELSVTCLVDGNDTAISEISQQWWESSNLTVVVDLPYAAVSSVAMALGWDGPLTLPATKECLEAVIAGRALEGLHADEAQPSAAVIAVAAAGACALLALLGVFGWWIVRRRQQRSRASKYATEGLPCTNHSGFLLSSWPGIDEQHKSPGSAGKSSEPLIKNMMCLMAMSTGTASPASTSMFSRDVTGLPYLVSPPGAWVCASYFVQLLRLKLGIVSHVIQQRKARESHAGDGMANQAHLIGNVIGSNDSPAGGTSRSGSGGIVGGTTIEKHISSRVLELQAIGPDYDIDFDKQLRPYMGMKLGEGAYGSVYRGLFKGQPVAVKIIRPEHFQGYDGHKALRSFVKEVQIMSQYRDDENIVKMLGACLRRPHVAIVYELMTMNLHSRIHSPLLPPLSPSESLRILQDVVEGLAKLHPDVVHRDMKPQNILLDSKGKAKLADFGLSRQVLNPLGSTIGTENMAGTPLYMSPEAFDGTSKHTQGDIYALGIIMNECLTRKIPYASRGYEHTFQIIYHVTVHNGRPDLAVGCPEQLRDLITRCWSKDSDTRPSINEVKETLDHLWETYFASAAKEAEKWSGGTFPHSESSCAVEESSTEATAAMVDN